MSKKLLRRAAGDVRSPIGATASASLASRGGTRSGHDADTNIASAAATDDDTDARVDVVDGKSSNVTTATKGEKLTSVGSILPRTSSTRLDEVSSPTVAAAGKSFSLDPFRRMLMGWDSPDTKADAVPEHDLNANRLAIDEHHTSPDASSSSSKDEHGGSEGGDATSAQAAAEGMDDGATPTTTPAKATMSVKSTPSDDAGGESGLPVDLILSPPPTDIAIGLGMLLQRVDEVDDDEDGADDVLASRPPLRGAAPQMYLFSDDVDDAGAVGTRQLNDTSPPPPPSDASPNDEGEAGRCSHDDDDDKSPRESAATAERSTSASKPDHANWVTVAPDMCREVDDMIRLAASSGEVDDPAAATSPTSTPSPQPPPPTGDEMVSKTETLTDGASSCRGVASPNASKLYDTPVVTHSAVKRERGQGKHFTGPFQPDGSPPEGTAPLPTSDQLRSDSDPPPSRGIKQAGAAVNAPMMCVPPLTSKAASGASTTETATEVKAGPAIKPKPPPISSVVTGAAAPKALPSVPAEPETPPTKPALSHSIAISRLNRERSSPEIAPAHTLATSHAVETKATPPPPPPPQAAYSSSADEPVAPVPKQVAAPEPRPPEKKAPSNYKTFGRVVLPEASEAPAAAKAPPPKPHPVVKHPSTTPLPHTLAAAAAAAKPMPVVIPAAPLAALPPAAKEAVKAAAAAGAAAAARTNAALPTATAATETAAAAATQSSPMRKSFRSIARAVATKIGFIKAATSVRAGVDMPLSDLSCGQGTRQQGNGKGSSSFGTASSLTSRLARSSSSSTSSSRHPASQQSAEAARAVAAAAVAASGAVTSATSAAAAAPPRAVALPGQSSSDAAPAQQGFVKSDGGGGGGHAGGTGGETAGGSNVRSVGGVDASVSVVSQPRRQARHSTGSLPVSMVVEEFKAKAAAVAAAAAAASAALSAASAAAAGNKESRDNRTKTVGAVASTGGSFASMYNKRRTATSGLRAVDDNLVNVRRSSLGGAATSGHGPGGAYAKSGAEKGCTTMVLPVIASKGTVGMNTDASRNRRRRVSFCNP